MIDSLTLKFSFGVTHVRRFVYNIGNSGNLPEVISVPTRRTKDKHTPWLILLTDTFFSSLSSLPELNCVHSEVVHFLNRTSGCNFT